MDDGIQLYMSDETQTLRDIIRYSIQDNDISASIIYALMQLNRTGSCIEGALENRSDFLEIIKHGRVLTFQPGATLIKKGEEGRCLYVILDGTVIVTREGAEQAVMQRGAMVGQMAVLTDRPRNSTVVAGDETVTVLAIKKETLFTSPIVYRCLLGNGLTIQGRQGTYELGRKLGEGMTSKVYAIGGENRKLCAKVYRHDLQYEGDYIAKFIGEHFTGLRHPNIVNTYEIVEAYGTYFIIMDWAQGMHVSRSNSTSLRCQTLRQLITEYGRRSAPVPRSLTERMFSHIGSALLYTHRRGYVHRDVKPENIFIDIRDSEPVFMLADFGLALPIHKRPEKINGTPHYFPPETLDLPSSSIGIEPAADLYSLAVVCFEALTGKKLFMGESVLDIIRQHRESPPDLSMLPDNMSPVMREFIQKSLNKQPADRPSVSRFEQLLRAAEREMP